MEVLYTADNLVISYDTEAKILYNNWIGAQSTPLIHHCGDVIYSLFVERRLSKILNDNRITTGSWYESVDWTRQVWFPKIIDAGLKHFAWIFPQDIFAELSAARAMPTADVVKVFTNYDRAYRWLLQQNQVKPGDFLPTRNRSEP